MLLVLWWLFGSVLGVGVALPVGAIALHPPEVLLLVPSPAAGVLLAVRVGRPRR